MKTAAGNGLVLEYEAPGGGVLSGRAYLIGSLLVVATRDAAAGARFPGLTRGTVDLAKVASEAWTSLGKVYWDNTAKLLTKESTDNTLVGTALDNVTVSVSLATNAGAAHLSIAGLVVTVLSYADLTGKTVTVTVGEVATVLVEGVDWNAETNNNTTAANLATAIDAVAGVTAAAVAAAVTVVAGTGITPTNAAVGRVRLDGVARA